MKITRIAIKNFLGLDHLDIAIERPVLLVSGPNAVGKTSIAHALRFILTDDLCRVEHKKDIKALIREGAKLGSVSVSLMNSDSDTGTVFEYTRSAATGHFTSPHPPPTAHPALKYCLDPPAFAEMEPNARLSFLYSLMGVNRSAASITKALEERGHARDNIERIQTHLSGGFAAAHTETMGMAREAKGRWRQITGETYGEVKAEGWSCDAPGVNPDDISRLRTDAATLDAEMGRLQVRRGAIAGRERERERLIKSQSQTRRIAEGLEVHRAAEAECRKKVDALEDEERTARLAVQESEAKTTVQAHAIQGMFFDCPVCGAHLNYSLGKCTVGAHEPADVSGEIAKAEAQAKQARGYLSKICNQLVEAERELTDATQAVARSTAAVEALAQLSEAVSDDEGESDDDIDDLFGRAVAQRDQALQALTALEAAHIAHENAKATTEKAKTLHEEIKALTALAADLAPDGLPGELLSRAMRPINERLRDSAVMAGWSSVSITTNGILIHSRPWALSSGSERWRANAMIAEAVAYISDVRCFVLDSLDILEPAQRAQALGWLCAIAIEHESIIVMATLKAQPKELPAAIQSVWLGVS